MTTETAPTDMALLRSVRQRAFTMIEIAAIIAMVGVLSAVTIVAVSTSRRQNEEQLAKQSLTVVSSGQLSFAQQYGVFTAWPDDLSLPEGPVMQSSPSQRLQEVSVAVDDDGNLGLAVGNGRGLCVMRRLDAPIRGGDAPEDTSVQQPGVACVGSAALDAGAVLVTPESKVPSQ